MSVEKGLKGEGIASRYLAENGYKVLEQNWRYQKAEVDLIAEKDNTVIFVEVKWRQTSDFGEPEVFVNRGKQKHLIRAAQAWADRNDGDFEIRFDIVALTGYESKLKVHHIEEAFHPTW